VAVVGKKLVTRRNSGRIAKCKHAAPKPEIPADVQGESRGPN